MYYQIHICLEETDGIFRHIPIYFCYTTDKEEAVKNFHKVCAQVFEFEDKPIIEKFPIPNMHSEIMRATGKVTKHYDVCGTYQVCLLEYRMKPTNPGII